MNNETLSLTRKIQLKVDLPTYEERKEAIGKLYQWQNRCFKAANIIVTHLYCQEMIKEFFYLTEDIQYKLADQKKDEDGILNRSRINTTYRVIADRFKGEIPMEILSNLNRNLESSFNKNKPKYWKGERSLKNFRRGGVGGGRSPPRRKNEVILRYTEKTARRSWNFWDFGSCGWYFAI